MKIWGGIRILSILIRFYEENAKRIQIDFSDIPPSKPTANGGFYYIQSLKMPKTDIHTKIDNDNLAWLKQAGKGYQSRLNNVIRWARLNNCPFSQM